MKRMVCLFATFLGMICMMGIVETHVEAATQSATEVVTGSSVSGNSQEEVKVEGIAIDSINFPGEALREDLLGREIGNDKILTQEEMDSVTELWITDENRQIDLTGIERFQNLQRVRVTGECIGSQTKKNQNPIFRGTLCCNPKLEQVDIDFPGTEFTQKELERIVPLSQLKILTLGGVTMDTLDLGNASKLEGFMLEDTLYVSSKVGTLNTKGASALNRVVIMTNVGKLDIRDNKMLSELRVAGSHKQMKLTNVPQLKYLELQEASFGKMDLSGAKNLEIIRMKQISCKKLDLRKNKKLKGTSFISGDMMKQFCSKTGETEEYYTNIKKSCKIILPKKNKIKNIEYYAKNKELDITQCRNLQEIHVAKHTKLKVKTKWYQKNRKKINIFVNGMKQKKMKGKKKRTTSLLRYEKLKDKNIYSMPPDEYDEDAEFHKWYWWGV